MNDEIRALIEENENLKKKLKAHSDLNARELHVRRQEQEFKKTPGFVNDAISYQTLKNIIKKSPFLHGEWERLMVYLKLTIDPEEYAKLGTLFDQ